MNIHKLKASDIRLKIITLAAKQVGKFKKNKVIPIECFGKDFELKSYQTYVWHFKHIVDAGVFIRTDKKGWYVYNKEQNLTN